MNLCNACGNQIVVFCGGPICLVCQHTGRAVECIGFDLAVPCTDRTATEIMMARNHAAALDRVYRVMDQGVIQTEEQAEQAALIEFEEAKERLSLRIRDQQHSREKPDWAKIDEEERERIQEICQTCLGTGRYLARRCPDCCEEDGD